jgi:NACalpha-BTF3-like transcription factor
LKENLELAQAKREVKVEERIEHRKSKFQCETIDIVCNQLNMQEKKIKQLEEMEKNALEAVQNTLRTEKTVAYKF